MSAVDPGVSAKTLNAVQSNRTFWRAYFGEVARRLPRSAYSVGD